MLRRKVIRMANNEQLRLRLGENLRRYLDQVVSWEVVVRQYQEAYALAREAKRTGTRVKLPLEF
jgi:glycosyltransferase involved in cell wall biosynthesis